MKISSKVSFKIIILSFLSIVLLACAEPRFDGSSKKSINKSLNNIRAFLPKNKMKRFNSSMRVLSVHFSGAHNSDRKAELIKLIDGKTGLEIIIEADKIRRL